MTLRGEVYEVHEEERRRNDSEQEPGCEGTIECYPCLNSCEDYECIRQGSVATQEL